MVNISGKLIEVGNLESGNGRGILLELDGNHIELTGLTEDECRALAPLYDKKVHIAISDVRSEEQKHV